MSIDTCANHNERENTVHNKPNLKHNLKQVLLFYISNNYSI